MLYLNQLPYDIFILIVVKHVYKSLPHFQIESIALIPFEGEGHL